MIVQTQTFDLPMSEERQALHDALWLMAQKRDTEAEELLIKRHDLLTADPKLKLYDQREERT